MGSLTKWIMPIRLITSLPDGVFGLFSIWGCGGLFVSDLEKKKGHITPQLGSHQFRVVPDSLKRADRIAKKRMALPILVVGKGRVSNFRAFPKFPKI